jgi:hypothetical protein
MVKKYTKRKRNLQKKTRKLLLKLNGGASEAPKGVDGPPKYDGPPGEVPRTKSFTGPNYGTSIKTVEINTLPLRSVSNLAEKFGGMNNNLKEKLKKRKAMQMQETKSGESLQHVKENPESGNAKTITAMEKSKKFFTEFQSLPLPPRKYKVREALLASSASNPYIQAESASASQDKGSKDESAFVKAVENNPKTTFTEKLNDETLYATVRRRNKIFPTNTPINASKENPYSELPVFNSSVNIPTETEEEENGRISTGNVHKPPPPPPGPRPRPKLNTTSPTNPTNPAKPTKLSLAQRITGIFTGTPEERKQKAQQKLNINNIKLKRKEFSRMVKRLSDEIVRTQQEFDYMELFKKPPENASEEETGKYYEKLNILKAKLKELELAKKNGNLEIETRFEKYLDEFKNKYPNIEINQSFTDLYHSYGFGNSPIRTKKNTQSQNEQTEESSESQNTPNTRTAKKKKNFFNIKQGLKSLQETKKRFAEESYEREKKQRENYVKQQLAKYKTDSPTFSPTSKLENNVKSLAKFRAKIKGFVKESDRSFALAISRILGQLNGDQGLFNSPRPTKEEKQQLKNQIEELKQREKDKRLELSKKYSNALTAFKQAHSNKLGNKLEKSLRKLRAVRENKSQPSQTSLPQTESVPSLTLSGSPGSQEPQESEEI